VQDTSLTLTPVDTSSINNLSDSENWFNRQFSAFVLKNILLEFTYATNPIFPLVEFKNIVWSFDVNLFVLAKFKPLHDSMEVKTLLDLIVEISVFELWVTFNKATELSVHSGDFFIIVAVSFLIFINSPDVVINVFVLQLIFCNLEQVYIFEADVVSCRKHSPLFR